MTCSRLHTRSIIALGALWPVSAAWADGTNAVALAGSPNLPDVAGSFVRMLAGLAFVFALFFLGVWVFKNWRRVARVRSHHKLNVIEARSLGPRQGIYVVGYEEQRFLIAASPAGIALVSNLPEASADEAVPEPNGAPASFAQVLHSVLGRK